MEFAKERAEEAARKAWREQFDLASARAVAALPMLAEYCLPLVKVGGSFLAMKGASGEEELAAPAVPSGSWAVSIRRPAPCICRAAIPEPSSSAKDFANSDSLPQKRWKDRKVSAEITKNAR